MDTSNDALMMFGRALLGDLCATSNLDKYSVLFTNFQLLARLVSLTLACFPVEDLVPSGIFSSFAHTRTLLSMCAIFVLVVVLCVCFFVREGQFFNDDQDQGMGKDYAELGGFGIQEEDTVTEDGAVNWRELVPVVPLVFLLNTVSWISLLVPGFYFTSLVGVEKTFRGTPLRIGFCGLAFQALIGFLFGTFLLERLNKRFGTLNVWLGASIALGLELLGTSFVWGKGGNAEDSLMESIGVVFMVGLTGVAYSTINTNPFTLVEKELTISDAQRGVAVGSISAGMPAAQFLVGTFAGIVIQFASVSFLFFIGGVMTLCLSLCFIPLWYYCGPRARKTEERKYGTF